ncbi:uncharacterized protein LOC115698057 [Cannabis sativa]|uniref:uncharacterized protein LOC115698057 n=1 Tax=Cannabis sativa TaxID=3483 RepID=UPI0029C9B81C|nr:uncharacterized protein LOC115698057 [Cannabis sativa]
MTMDQTFQHRTRKEKKNQIMKYHKEEKDDDDLDNESDYENLPEHVLYKTFTNLQFDLEEVRLVCKRWFNLISCTNFINQNFLQSKPSLLIQSTSGVRKKFKSKLLELADDDDDGHLDEGLRFNVTKFGMTRMGKFRSSCNGLILLEHTKRFGYYRTTCAHHGGYVYRERPRIYGMIVTNVMTKTHISLPICPSKCTHLRCWQDPPLRCKHKNLNQKFFLL